jgi:hypothetical protein
VAEGVARADYCGVPCQIRCDWVSDSWGLVDLKTCDNLDAFAHDARRFGYMHQLAFYQAILAIIGEMAPVNIIAVEKRQPYRVGVWALDGASLEQAARENGQAIGRLVECWDSGHWPTGYEARRTLSL